MVCTVFSKVVSMVLSIKGLLMLVSVVSMVILVHETAAKIIS